MLGYCRPHLGETEQLFIEKFIDPLGTYVDGYGNRWIEVGTDNHILWSSHTDTMHHKDGKQPIEISRNWAGVAKPFKKAGTCLGADDTAGVWLMIEMIKAKRPGLYVFHRGEEMGGLGSSYVACDEPWLLKGIECAVALDRKGYTSVITHQGGRTASDKFARELATKLGMGFKPDDTGLFTDTANYTDLVGECTNISVGYFNQHGPTETLDLEFIQDLRTILLETDFQDLHATREPGENELIQRYTFAKPDTLAGWVEDNPDLAADLLETLGYTIKDCEEFEAQVYGYPGRNH
jgi:hypothetical protein